MSQRVVEVRPSAIVVTDRHRSDLGDLTSLKESIQSVGLIQPIVCRMENERLRLVAGERRLEACRQLGKSLVQVVVAKNLDDATRALQAERDENHCRKDMTPTELKSLTDALLGIEREAAKERQRAAGGGAGRRGGDARSRNASDHGVGSDPKPQEAKAAAAKAAGWSRSQYERVERVERAVADEALPESVRAVAADALEKLKAGTMSPKKADDAVKDAKVDAGVGTTAEKIAKAKRDNPTPTGSGKSRAEVEQKIATYKRMADEGFSTRQIAPAIGVGLDSMWEFRRRHGLEAPPADAVVGKTRRFDSTRILSEVVYGLEGTRMSIDLIDLSEVDPEERDYWVSSLTESIKSITTLKNRLKELTRAN